MSIALLRAPISSGAQRQRSHAPGLVDADGHAGVVAFGQPGAGVGIAVAVEVGHEGCRRLDMGGGGTGEGRRRPAGFQLL